MLQVETQAARPAKRTKASLRYSERRISIIRLPQLMVRLGLATATIYDKLNPRSPRHDASFPRPVSLGMRAVGWVEHEIDEWLAARIKQSRKGGA